MKPDARCLAAMVVAFFPATVFSDCAEDASCRNATNMACHDNLGFENPNRWRWDCHNRFSDGLAMYCPVYNRHLSRERTLHLDEESDGILLAVRSCTWIPWMSRETWRESVVVSNETFCAILFLGDNREDESWNDWKNEAKVRLTPDSAAFRHLFSEFHAIGNEAADGVKGGLQGKTEKQMAETSFKAIRAAENDDVAGLRTILEAGANPNWIYGCISMSSHAARFGATNVISFLRDYGLSIAKPENRFQSEVHEWALRHFPERITTGHVQKRKPQISGERDQ